MEKFGKILAIDDQKSMRDLLHDTSHSLGYQMELAADGRKGLEMFGGITML